MTHSEFGSKTTATEAAQVFAENIADKTSKLFNVCAVDFWKFCLNGRSEFGHSVELGGSEGGGWLHRKPQPCLNIKGNFQAVKCLK